MVELLDRIAQVDYGEFGFSTCTDEQQLEIISKVIKNK